MPIHHPKHLAFVKGCYRLGVWCLGRPVWGPRSKRRRNAAGQSMRCIGRAGGRRVDMLGLRYMGRSREWGIVALGYVGLGLKYTGRVAGMAHWG